MFYTYILASKKSGTLYIGQTSDLRVRMVAHKEKQIAGFTSKYGCDRLVWYEVHLSRSFAFTRERQLKKWSRQWKINLIRRKNPYWADLTNSIPRDPLSAPKWFSDEMKGEIEAYEKGVKYLDQRLKASEPIAPLSRLRGRFPPSRE